MRTLKFRLWDDKKKCWMHGPNKDNSLDGCNILGEMMIMGEFAPVSIERLNDLVVLQCTGLKDRNGKDIFEGDILASRANEKPCNYIVKWGENQSDYCGFVLNPVMKDPPRITFHIHNFQMWMAEGFEVIGNIYDNPELLTALPQALPPLPPRPELGPPGACVNGCGSEACIDGKCSSCGGECKQEPDLDICPQCDEYAWDGRICHACGAKDI